MKQDKPYHVCDNTKGILLRYPTFVEFAFVKNYRALFFALDLETRVSTNSSLLEIISKFVYFKLNLV